MGRPYKGKTCSCYRRWKIGNVSIGVSGYLAILTQVVLMAMVTALTSRRTVNRTLESID